MSINREMVARLGEKRLDQNLVYDSCERRVTSEHHASAVEFFYIECVDAAAAVYLHNALTYVDLFAERAVDYRDHPIAWLLFLCDQLQEWFRPSGGGGWLGLRCELSSNEPPVGEPLGAEAA